MEELTLVGLFMEGTTLTCLEMYSDAKKRLLAGPALVLECYGTSVIDFGISMTLELKWKRYIGLGGVSYKMIFFINFVEFTTSLYTLCKLYSTVLCPFHPSVSYCLSCSALWVASSEGVTRKLWQLTRVKGNESASLCAIFFIKKNKSKRV